MEYSAAHVVLSVRGALDALTAPEVGALLVGMADRRRVSVVLDLAQCSFIDAAGVHMIGEGAEELALWGGNLSIRNPSAVVRRLLELVGLRDLGPLSAPELPAEHGGPLLTTGAATVERSAAGGAMRLAVSLARTCVGGADGASVSLRRKDRLTTVAASDKTVRDMDADQYATGQGPCVDASVEGLVFHARSLHAETRWPAFTPLAQALGISAIVSSPLLVADRPVGALNIYSRTDDAFGAIDRELAVTIAAELSTILTDEVLDPEARRTSWPGPWLGAALETRQLIALAQGVLMERHGIDDVKAYTALRRFSARTGRPLRSRADDVIASAGRGGSGARSTEHDG